jgi:hypothetical protein
MIILVQHHVRDFDAWKTVFDEHEEIRRNHESLGHSVFRGGEDGNTVTIMSHYADRAHAEAFAADPSLHEAMARGGVDSEPTVSFLDEVETLDYAFASAV